MRLADAIRVVEKMLADQKGERAIALMILLRFTKKVVRLQQPIRDLSRALAPEARLDQEGLFGEEEDTG